MKSGISTRWHLQTGGAPRRFDCILLLQLCDGSYFLYRVKKNLKFTRWSLFLSQEAYWSTRFLLMFLFSTGLDVDACTKSGVTPLMMTARQCSTGRCEMLIEAGANLNIRDINQDTALALSVCCRCEHNTRLLIVNGADLNTGNEG